MFKLTLVTPNKKLLTDVEVEEVIVPAHNGQLDILPGHAPLVSTLSVGVIKVKIKGDSKYTSAAIGWGYIEVNPTGILVLADYADWPKEINKEQAKIDYQKASERLQEAGLLIDDKIRAQRDLDLQKARIELVDNIH